MKITVETAVKAPLGAVWSAWSDPDQIKPGQVLKIPV